MARWRLARSLTKLREEVNAAYPGRPTNSDGTIGDAAHSSRKSDHNPNSAGIVCALDLTEWVQNGIEMNDVLAEILRASRDPRIKYVISDGRMFSSYSTSHRRAWEWGPYNGFNKHTKHVHVSVLGHYADTITPWNIKTEEYQMPPTIREGTNDAVAVAKLRGLLMAHGFKLHQGVSGAFGPGLKAIVQEFQRRYRLKDDGVVGPNTWRALIEK